MVNILYSLISGILLEFQEFSHNFWNYVIIPDIMTYNIQYGTGTTLLHMYHVNVHTYVCGHNTCTCMYRINLLPS